MKQMKGLPKIRTVAIALAVMIPAGAPILAYAQEEAAKESVDRRVNVLEEIIVTARKRATSVLDTPIAISAFTSEDIQAAAFENIIDVAKAAPGLFIETINGVNAKVNTSPRFRGVTFESDSPLQRTGSIFIDGVLVSGGIQSIGVQELERVEVIKGPQSALFGRNTFSGAINYVTKTPANEFGGDLQLTGASKGEYSLAGSVEGPIAGEALTGRLNGSFTSKDGHYDNAIVEGQRLGDEEGYSLSGTLAFKPSENFKARVRINAYEDEHGPAAFIRSAGFSQHNFGGFPFADGSTTETVFRGTVPVPTGDQIALDTSQEVYDASTGAALADPRGVSFLGFDFSDLGGPGLIREGNRVAIDAQYEFANGMTLDFLAGENEDEYLVYTDFDASPGFGFNTTGGSLIEDSSVEVRLSGVAVNERLNWSIGANKVDIDVITTGGFYDGLLGFWFPGVFEEPTVTRSETTGVFGTIDYQFNDKWTLIVEARQQEDKIFEDAINQGLAVPISPATFDKFLPRVLLQYKPNDDSLIYFNYSVGNLPGGFNAEVGELDATQLAEFQGLVPGVGTTFGEEALDNFELGWKKTALDGRLAFNLALFYMERSDQIFSGFEVVQDPTQVNGVRTVAFTANGASSDITGLELEGTWNVSDGFSLQGSLGYTNAEISSFPAGANSGDFTAVFGPDASVQGQQAPRFPEWTASLSATYEKTVGLGEWYTRTDTYYTGSFYDENTNLAELPSAFEVNLRTGLRFENDMTVELFVTNLFDEDAPVGGNNIADTGFDVRTQSGLFDFTQESIHVALRDERQVGVRVFWDF